MDKPTVDPKRTGLKSQLADFSDDEFAGYAEPGRVQFLLDKNNGDYLLLACPGCGRVAGMHVGEQKPNSPPSWLMKGDKKDVATVSLSPSINCVGCCSWHGYLTNGAFISC